MSESIFIASRRPLLADIAELFRSNGEEVLLLDTQLQLPFVIVDVLHDWPEEPIPPLDAPWRLAGDVDPGLLQLRYYGWEHGKAAALLIARSYDVWVDDTACFEDTGEAFVRYCEEHPSWSSSVTGTARSAIRGMEYYDQPDRDDHWLGTDANGHVACFATRGRGPVPHSYAWVPFMHQRAIGQLLALEKTEAPGERSRLGGEGERAEWAQAIAERGVHVYVAEAKTDAYRRIAAPASPRSVRELPFEIAHPTRMNVWEHMRFAEDEAIDFDLFVDGFV